MDLSIDVQEMQSELQKIRRDLHQIPELGFEEYKTAKYIEDYLKTLEVEYQSNLTGTAIVACIKGFKGEKTYGFRADMDALSIEEQNNISFKSLHTGKMHACGHDGHITVLLGLAKYLKQSQQYLRDNVILIFQPAEEGPGGALPLVQEGILKRFDVKEIYGLHLFPEIEEGKIGLRSGAMMSQTGEFDIYVKGKGSHGAMPHMGLDAIIVASELVLGMQSIVSRNIDPLEPAVLTVGRMISGERRNVIASDAMLEGTIRAFNQEVYDKIKSRMLGFIRGLEETYQCNIEIVFRDMYPAVYNNEYLTEEFIKAQGDGIIEAIKPVMLSEDFSYYQREIPGVFFFLGCRNEEKGYCYPLHNNRFNFDEKILGYGVQAFVNVLIYRGAIQR